jgi:hypothetical protein
MLTHLKTRDTAQSLPEGADKQFYDLGLFQLATQGMQNAVGTIGELWCSYEVEFFKPQISHNLTIGQQQFQSLSKAIDDKSIFAPFLAVAKKFFVGANLGSFITPSTFQFNDIAPDGVYELATTISSMSNFMPMPGSLTINTQQLELLNNFYQGFVPEGWPILIAPLIALLKSGGIDEDPDDPGTKISRDIRTFYPLLPAKWDEPQVLYKNAHNGPVADDSNLLNPDVDSIRGDNYSGEDDDVDVIIHSVSLKVLFRLQRALDGVNDPSIQIYFTIPNGQVWNPGHDHDFHVTASITAVSNDNYPNIKTVPTTF